MQRKVFSEKLEIGVNSFKVPTCAQILGFDAVGSLRVIYDVPLFVEGVDPVKTETLHLHVVPVGDVFETTATQGWQFLATATPPAKRPVAIYQVWNF